MIKHYRKRGNICVLEMNEDRVILSNPRIQPFNEYGYNSKDDILYFYYDVKLQHNTTWYAFDGLTKEERDELYPGIKPNWVTCATSSIYEFGAIQNLAEYIDEIIKINPDENGQTDFLYSGMDGMSKTDFEAVYELSCTGMLKEDSYILKKYHRHFQNSWNDETKKYEPRDYVWYDLYIGLGSERRNNTTGVMFHNLAEEELLVLKAWAEDFMELAKTVTQANIEKKFASDNDADYYEPKWFRDHIMEKYPEDIDQWKDIWIKLYSETFILEEYWNYVKGRPIETPYFSRWPEEKLVAQDLIKEGMKDWEAYCKLIDFYNMANRKKGIQILR